MIVTTVHPLAWTPKKEKKRKSVSGAVCQNIKYGKTTTTYKPKSNFTRSVAKKAFY